MELTILTRKSRWWDHVCSAMKLRTTYYMNGVRRFLYVIDDSLNTRSRTQGGFPLMSFVLGPSIPQPPDVFVLRSLPSVYTILVADPFRSKGEVG